MRDLKSCQECGQCQVSMPIVLLTNLLGFPRTVLGLVLKILHPEKTGTVGHPLTQKIVNKTLDTSCSWLPGRVKCKD